MQPDVPPCVQQSDIFEQPAVAASGRAAEEPFFDVLSKIEETQAMPDEADPVPSLSRPAEELADVPSAFGGTAASVQEALADNACAPGRAARAGPEAGCLPACARPQKTHIPGHAGRFAALNRIKKENEICRLNCRPQILRRKHRWLALSS